MRVFFEQTGNLNERTPKQIYQTSIFTVFPGREKHLLPNGSPQKYIVLFTLIRNYNLMFFKPSVKGIPVQV